MNQDTNFLIQDLKYEFACLRNKQAFGELSKAQHRTSSSRPNEKHAFGQNLEQKTHDEMRETKDMFPTGPACQQLKRNRGRTWFSPQPTNHRATNEATAALPPAPNHLFHGQIKVVASTVCEPRSSTQPNLANQQPTNPQRSSQPTNNQQHNHQTNNPTNRQPTTHNPRTNRQTNQPQRTKTTKSRKPKLRWPGGLCRAAEYGAPPTGVVRVKSNFDSRFLIRNSLHRPRASRRDAVQMHLVKRYFSGHGGSRPGHVGSQPAICPSPKRR